MSVSNKGARSLLKGDCGLFIHDKEKFAKRTFSCLHMQREKSRANIRKLKKGTSRMYDFQGHTYEKRKMKRLVCMIFEDIHTKNEKEYILYV